MKNMPNLTTLNSLPVDHGEEEEEEEEEEDDEA